MRLRIKRGEVTFLNNSVIRNAGLSFGALGLLAYLLSMDEGESVEDDVLCEAGICGSDELAGYKVELRAARLLVSMPSGNESVYDEPQEAM